MTKEILSLLEKGGTAIKGIVVSPQFASLLLNASVPNNGTDANDDKYWGVFSGKEYAAFLAGLIMFVAGTLLSACCIRRGCKLKKRETQLVRQANLLLDEDEASFEPVSEDASINNIIANNVEPSDNEIVNMPVRENAMIDDADYSAQQQRNSIIEAHLAMRGDIRVCNSNMMKLCSALPMSIAIVGGFLMIGVGITHNSPSNTDNHHRSPGPR